MHEARPHIAAPSQRRDTPHVATRPRAAFALPPESLRLIYGPEQRAELERLSDVGDVPITREGWRQQREILSNVELLFHGWGGPVLDADFLVAAPKLRAVFYGAGTVRGIVTEAFWQRRILLTSAFAANALPVAEYALGVILLSLRDFWKRAADARLGQGWGDHTRPIRGSFRARVGLVSFGAIARKLAEHLRSFDLHVSVYCPFLTDSEATEYGVEKVSLEQIFSTSDVVSVHTPLLPETERLITAALVASMPPSATLLNTARGRILDQRPIEAVLRQRPDLHAILDVTEPEPPTASDPLFELGNVVVTSHIAGSHGRDCYRLGQYVVEELKAYSAGKPALWPITRETAGRMA